MARRKAKRAGKSGRGTASVREGKVLTPLLAPLGTMPIGGEGLRAVFTSWPGILFFSLAFLLLATLPYGMWRKKRSLEEEAAELLEELRFLEEAMKKVEKDLFPREGEELEGDPTLLLRREAFLHRIEDFRTRSIPEAVEELARAQAAGFFRKVFALESAIAFARGLLEEGGRYLVLPPSVVRPPRTEAAVTREDGGTPSSQPSREETRAAEGGESPTKEREVSRAVDEREEAEGEARASASVPALSTRFSFGNAAASGGGELRALVEEDERTAALLTEVRAKLGLRLTRLEERRTALQKEVADLALRWNEGRPPLPETLRRLRNAYGEIRDEVRQLVAWGEKIEGEMPEAIKRLEAELQALTEVAPLAEAGEAEEHLRAMKLLWHRLPPLWDRGDLPSLRDVGEAFARRKELLEELLTAERNRRAKVDGQLAALREELDEFRELLAAAAALVERLQERYILPAEVRPELAARAAEYESLLRGREAAEGQVRAREFRQAEASLRQLLEASAEGRRGMRAFLEWLDGISREEAEIRRRLEEVGSRLRRLAQEIERVFYTDRTPYHERIATLEQELPTWEGRLSLRPLDLAKVKEEFRTYLDLVEAVEEETHADLQALREAERVVLHLNAYRFDVPEVGRWLMEAENAFWDGRFREAQGFARRALETGAKLGVFQGTAP
ncbi:septation ring formation regulator EzrA [Brockia lithotrophica]|uniref:Septation ring formation regulator EzrA n=1 Tax=Brockia lithotrophica TaxID=933949 RepID=A0A660KT49_9BACL|nr:septation ring formation regulator EzrA [Brockia lithotrophica]RKQ83671.1 septation ring formation regulator EzrA [Brockia lithotrophica]